MQVFQDFSLSQVLWYKIGGKTKYFLLASSKEDILRALDFVEKNHIKKLFICGKGSNLIFTDAYFDGAVIQILQSEKSNETVQRLKNSQIEVFSGEILDNVIKATFEQNLIGLEWAGGLPGTVGAGIRGNVGAFGGEISNNLTSAEVLQITSDGFDVKKINKDNLHFSYRNSLIKENRNIIVLAAEFLLNRATYDQIKDAERKYTTNIEYRQKNHPLEYPNCGSVFKNIIDQKNVDRVVAIWPDIAEFVKNNWHGKVSMGYVIRRLGFSGYTIHDAQVSEKHANFIVNTHNASAKDVLSIISHIQEKMSGTFGFIPEVEVEIVS